MRRTATNQPRPSTVSVSSRNCWFSVPRRRTSCYEKHIAVNIVVNQRAAVISWVASINMLTYTPWRKRHPSNPSKQSNPLTARDLDAVKKSGESTLNFACHDRKSQATNENNNKHTCESVVLAYKKKTSNKNPTKETFIFELELEREARASWQREAVSAATLMTVVPLLSPLAAPSPKPYKRANTTASSSSSQSS